MEVSSFKKARLLAVAAACFLSLLSSAFSGEGERKLEEGRHHGQRSLLETTVINAQKIIVRCLAAQDLSCFMRASRTINEDVRTIVKQASEIKSFLIQQATQKLEGALECGQKEEFWDGRQHSIIVIPDVQRVARLLYAGLNADRVLEEMPGSENKFQSFISGLFSVMAQYSVNHFAGMLVHQSANHFAEIMLRHGATLSNAEKQSLMNTIVFYLEKTEIPSSKFHQLIRIFVAYDDQLSIGDFQYVLQRVGRREGEESKRALAEMIKEAASPEKRKETRRLKEHAMGKAAKGLLAEEMNSPQASASALHAPFNGVQGQQDAPQSIRGGLKNPLKKGT